MKIAFYVPNIGLKKIDFSRPQDGNPGTGAAEYLHVALPFYISSQEYECFIYAQNVENMPDNLECIKCESIRDAALKAKKNGIDIFVFRPRINEEDNILQLIDEIELVSIGRAALTPSIEHQRQMSKSKYFKSLVAVGSEQYDYLCDSPVSKKLTYIDNGISILACQKYKSEFKNIKLITYMGAIVPQKGFHILARIWPKILAQHPDAELRVIGSSKIYNENYVVGPLNVADREYEEKYIIPFLCDNQGSLLPSVTFLGALGNEKYRHLSESLISVPNPSGDTETCCVSAIEMQASGAAVVTGAYHALLGTVRHGITGLLGRGDEKLLANICYLLDNPNIAIEMGKRGEIRSKEIYDFTVVSSKWKRLFTAIDSESIIKPPHKYNYIIYHRKWLRIANSQLVRFSNDRFFWPSVQEIEYAMLKVYSIFKK